MKKKYVKPDMEITEFDIEDVITTSSEGTGQDGGVDSGNTGNGNIKG